MTDTVSVEYDDRELVAAVGRLATGIPRAATRAGSTTAAATATQIRATVPKRSGRLAGTVTATATPTGGQVAYGGGLAYAGYIEGRSHAVARAVASSAPAFVRACDTAAAREVNAL